MAILANGNLSEDTMPVENVAPHGFSYKFSGRFPLSLTKCNKLAEHYRASIKTLGTDPRADAWKADLAQLEAHIEQVRARDKARRQR